MQRRCPEVLLAHHHLSLLTLEHRGFRADLLVPKLSTAVLFEVRSVGLAKGRVLERIAPVVELGEELGDGCDQPRVAPLDTVRVPCLRKVKKGFVDLLFVGVDVKVKEGKEVELEERFDVLEQLLVVPARGISCNRSAWTVSPLRLLSRPLLDPTKLERDDGFERV